MNDTSVEIEKLVREKLMARSGEEGMIMGARSFDAARQMILASFPPDLSAMETRHRLFERVYGKKLEDFIGTQS